MYKTWSHTGKELESFPGVDVEIYDGTSVKVTISYWRSGHCFYAFNLVFEHALVNMQVYDESNHLFIPPNWPSNDDFSENNLFESPVWVEYNSERIHLYQGEVEDITFYESIDSYLFAGQDIMLLLDVSSCKPKVQEISLNSINKK